MNATSNSYGPMATIAPALAGDTAREHPEQTLPPELAQFYATRETATGPLRAFLDKLINAFEETGDPSGVCAQLVAAIENGQGGSHPDNWVCPDGVPWCEGDPEDHADPREHHHSGPSTRMDGSYLQIRDDLMVFHLIQWNDAEPRLMFQADGTWPELDLKQVDELAADELQHLVRLHDARRKLRTLTIDRKYGRTTTSADMADDLSDAAVSVALTAMSAALKSAPDRTRTPLALRTALDLTETDAYEA